MDKEMKQTESTPRMSLMLAIVRLISASVVLPLIVSVGGTYYTFQLQNRTRVAEEQFTLMHDFDVWREKLLHHDRGLGLRYGNRQALTWTDSVTIGIMMKPDEHLRLALELRRLRMRAERVFPATVANEMMTLSYAFGGFQMPVPLDSLHTLEGYAFVVDSSAGVAYVNYAMDLRRTWNMERIHREAAESMAAAAAGR